MDELNKTKLVQRLGQEYATKRLNVEESHAAQIFGQGLNFFHIENWYSIHSLIRNTLRLAFMHKKGKKNARNIQTRHNTITLPNLHADMEGFTILHLSDLHLDMDQKATHALIEKLREVEYDMCVMTGDYRARTFGEIEGALGAMKDMRLHLSDPVYAVLGNHDSIQMVPPMEEMGIKMLINENTQITRGNGKILLAGIDDAHYFRADDIPRAATGLSVSTPSVLLSHTPEVYKKAAEAGFDLIFCGHTHGGQICLPGGIPLTLDSDCPRFVGKGPWRYQSMQGYTSVGAGTSVVNVRINCLPEITLHTLTSKN